MLNMKTLLFIFLGGGIGSILRYIISSLEHKLFPATFLPISTLFVNILGCFIIGYCSSLFKDYSCLRPLFITGFCGGFTTFSTFSSENINLLLNGQFLSSIIYIALSIILGLLAVYLGIHVSKQWNWKSIIYILNE